MKSSKLVDFVEKTIPAAGLLEGVDYEIVSFYVFSAKEMEFHPVNRYYGIDALSLAGRKVSKGLGKKTASVEPAETFENRLKKEIANKTGQTPNGIMPTTKPRTFHQSASAALFYKIASPIDYDTAISLGFGIVRMLKSPHQDDFLLYYFNTALDEEDDEGTDEYFDFMHDRIDEIMMLKCYLQLTANGSFHDPSLAEYIEENYDYLCFAMFCNQTTLIQKILMSIDQNRGELILLPKNKNQ